MSIVTTNNPYGTTSQVVTTNSDSSKDVKTYAGLNGSGGLIEEAAVTAANVTTIISPMFTLNVTFNGYTTNAQSNQTILTSVTFIYDDNQLTSSPIGGGTQTGLLFSGIIEKFGTYAPVVVTPMRSTRIAEYPSDPGANVQIVSDTGNGTYIYIALQESAWSPSQPISVSVTLYNLPQVLAAITDSASIAARGSNSLLAQQPPSSYFPGGSFTATSITAGSVSASDPGPQGLFDTTYYLAHDTAAAARVTGAADALADYMATGWKEGADPSASFSTAAYLSAHPDAAASGIDPLTYYENVGKAAGETVTTVAQWAAANAPPANTGSGGSTTIGGTVPLTPIVSTPTGSTSGGSSAGISTPTTAAITPATIAVYRFFDKADGTHFFTASASERATVDATRADMTDEGAGLNSVQSTDPNAVAVYRFFDTRFGTHFFTASSTERDSVIATRADLTYEGVGFYEHSAQQSGDVAVYRFFDTVHGTHFYSSSASEVAQIAATRTDLTNEGVGFYAPGTAST